MKSKKDKSTKLTTLQDKADKAMSLYIRQKFADFEGMVTCVACGRLLHWSDADCGHFIPKSRGAAIRYVEENVHPECRGCNRFNDGHLIGYALYMIDMYGREKIEELKNEAKKVLSPSEKKRITVEAFEYYSEQLKELGNGR